MNPAPDALEVSVVIPVLNEAHALPLLLEQLTQQQGVRLEAIVVDGGSTDGTGDRARECGARVLTSAPGRGVQMNTGAAAAHADVLFFLHADSGLTHRTQLADGLRTLKAARAAAGPRVAGHYELRFARRSLGHPLFYRFLEEKTATNRPYTVNGDQGLLIGADWFFELGGFDTRLPFLEDQRLAARIFESGAWVTLPGRLLTSPRRFESEGHYRRYTLMAIIMGMYVAGVDEFFRRAPRVYATQAEAHRLRLGRYLGLVWRILVEAGWRGAAGILYRAGGFARRNSWQLFFWCDVLLRPALGKGRYPFLWVHDRLLRPLIDHRVADAATGALVGLWFLVLLPPAYWVLDRLRA